MPRGDGTGPNGQGPMGGGRGQGGNIAGPIGFCVCTKCGHKEPHQRGNPCTNLKCPKCGAQMTRG